MDLTVIDKKTILDFLKTNSIDDMYSTILLNKLNKKVEEVKVFEYILELINKELEKCDKYSQNKIVKLLLLVNSFMKCRRLNINELKRYSSKFNKIKILYQNAPLNILNDEIIKEKIGLFDDYISLEEESIEIDEIIEDVGEEKQDLPSPKDKTIKKKNDTIDKLSKEIERLNRELNAQKRLNQKQIAEVKKSYNKACQSEENYLRVASRIESLEKQLSNSVGKEKILLDKMGILYDKIKKLENENTKKDIDITLYKELNEKLNRKISEKSAMICDLKSELAIDDFLDKYMLNLLINFLSFDDLKYYLSSVGYNLSNKQIYEQLEKIKKKYQLEVKVDDNVIKYRLGTNNYRYNSLNIENSSKRYDILFISDWHIKREDAYLKRAFDLLNEYAIKNNIQMLANLGDNFDFGEMSKSVERCEQNFYIALDTINSFIKNGNFDKNIIYAFLGGNHDKRANRYGIDFLKIITEAKCNAISLGYSSCLLKFNNQDMIGLYHDNINCYSNFHTNKDYTDINVMDYLNRYSLDNNIKLDEIFLNIFGHFHLGRVDLGNRYYLLPSLKKDFYNNGALQLSLYFREDGSIDYGILYPLVILSQYQNMTKVNELVLKK